MIAAVSYCVAVAVLHAEEPPVGIIGKNQWLFYRYELTDRSDATATDQSLDLVYRFSRVLASNGITLAVVMVPLKMRIYAEHLPDDVKLNSYMEVNYERMSKLLRKSGVAVVDLNAAFLNSPKRNSSSPLFYKLDTHWTQTGAMVAAETIQAEIETTPWLKKALVATPEESYNLVVGTRKIPSEGRDLIGQLPPNSIKFAYEQVTPVSVVRVRPAQQGLFGANGSGGVALLGSSYSRDWTGFVDALRYVLQRDIFSMGVGADQGSWVGMETYLRDDAFQLKAPKLLIWEMPERDMRAPPDYEFRELRYISNNTEWLLRASAWVQAECKPSTVGAKISSAGLGGRAGNLRGGDLTTGPTNEGDFLEIGFDRPLDKLDYVDVRATVSGATTLVMEGSGVGAASRKFTLNVMGDGAPHLLKTPLPSRGNGFTKVRVYPGRSGGIELQRLRVCRQPGDLLE